MIISRSPLRVTLGGGGTDLPSYYEKFGGFLIAAAIDKYVYITLHENFMPDLIVKYSRLERVENASKLEHPIMRESFAALGMDGLRVGSDFDGGHSRGHRTWFIRQFHHGAAQGAARAQKESRFTPPNSPSRRATSN